MLHFGFKSTFWFKHKTEHTASVISEKYYGKWFGFCELMLLSVNWEFFPHLSGKCQFFTSPFPVVPVRVRGFFHTQRRYNGRVAPVRLSLPGRLCLRYQHA